MLKEHILVGHFKAMDPIGTYQLIKKPWSLFQVRLSLDVENDSEEYNIENVTVEDILNNSLTEYTILHYYFSRIFHKDSLRLLEAPKGWEEWPAPPSSTTDTN